MKAAFFSEILSIGAVFATAYGYTTGNYNLVNIGVGISWIYIVMFSIVFILSFIVLAAGGEEAKAKLKESFTSKGAFRRAWSVLKVAVLVSLLCLCGSVVTAVLLGIISILMWAIRASIDTK